jgi:hypothetical protein
MGNVGDIFPGGTETDTPGGDPQGDIADGQIDQPDTQGKYLLVGVKGFDEAQTMSAYLRLGAASAHAGEVGTPSPTGEDLAALVQGFADDDRSRGATPARGTASGQRPLDDPTLSPAQNVADGVDVAALARETAALHHKGGWRDHSDGNRVTTTRGDKVEIISGNYKLLVLGRLDTDGIDTDADKRKAVIQGGTGFDLSGGLLDNDPGDLADPAAALNIEYTWGPDNHGKWGWTQTTTNGSPNLGPSDVGNGRIINRTFVDLLDEQLGSSDRPVSFVNEVMCANALTVEQHVEGLNNNLVAGGVLNTINQVDLMNSLSLVIGSMNTQILGGMLEADAGVVIGYAQLAGIIATILEAVWVVDEHVGIHVDNHEGIHSEIRVGVHTETVFGLHTDAHIGIHLESHLGTHIELENSQFQVNGETVGAFTGPDVSMTTAHALDMATAGLHTYGIHVCFCGEYACP